MSAVVVTADLNAPPAEVWDVVMDPHQLERWVTIHRKLTHADDGPPRVGYRMGQRYVIRGAPVKVSWELEAMDPPHSADWAGHGPAGAGAAITYRLEPLDGGSRTRFHYSNTFSAPGGRLGAVASRALMGGVPEREAHASLARLSEVIDAR
ncbi:MAG: SRPBCC family protein [Solirubrobacteraceae bacterium]|nr:SRPBCC family protein [Solirubrobacteraceae bacterium]